MPPGTSTYFVFVKFSTNEGIHGWSDCTVGAVSVKNVVGIAQRDICHAGGILELKKIAAMAKTH